MRTAVNWRTCGIDVVGNGMFDSSLLIIRLREVWKFGLECGICR